MDETLAEEQADVVTSNLLSSFFVTLPDLKPTNLGEFNYCLFLLFITSNDAIRRLKIINDICVLIYIFQMFSVTCLLSLYDFIQHEGKFDLLFRAMYFSLYLTWDPRKVIIDQPLFFYIIDLLGIVCISLFFYGLVQMSRRKCIGLMTKLWIVLVSIHLPKIFLLIYANSISYSLSTIAENNHVYHVHFTVLTIIIFVLLFYIRFVTTTTITSSFIFNVGFYVPHSFSYYQDCISFALIALFNVSAFNMELLSVLIILSVAMLVFGVLQVYRFYCASYISIESLAFIATHGCTLILSSIIGFLQTFNLMNHDQMSVYTILIISVVLYIFILFILKKRNQMILENLQNVSCFDQLNITSSTQYLTYFQVGITQCVDYMLNGDFIKWGMEEVKKSGLLIRLICYLSIIPGTEKIIKDVSASIPLNTNRTQSEKFAIFHHEKISNLRVVKAPNSLRFSIIEVERQIDQYQNICTTFFKCIAPDSKKSFLFLDALSSIRLKLQNFIGALRDEYPNCADVLKLYSSYMEKVEFDYQEADRLRNLSVSLESGEVEYIDFQYLNVGSGYPKLQTYLQNKAKRQATNTGSYHDLGYRSNKRQVATRTLKETVYYNISNASILLIFIGILIMFFGCAHKVEIRVKHTREFFNFYRVFANASLVFISIYYPSLRAIYYGELPKIKHTSFNEFKNSSLNIQDSYKSCATDSPEFNETNRWFYELHKFPSIYSEMDVYIEICSAFSRSINAYYSLFSENFSTNHDKINNVINTFVHTSNTIAVSFHQYLESKNSFFDLEKKNLLTDINNCSIFLMILAVLTMIMPFIMKREVFSLIKFFPSNKEEKEKAFLLTFFLEKDFTTITRMIINYFLVAFSAICLNILMGVGTLNIFRLLCQNLNDRIDLIDVYYKQYFFSASSVGSLYGSSVLNSSIESISANINSTIDFFINSKLITFDLTKIENGTHPFAEFSLLLIRQVKGKQIAFNNKSTNYMNNLLDTILIPDIKAKTKDIAYDAYKLIDTYNEYLLVINLLLSIVAMLLFIVWVKLILKNQGIIDIALHILSQYNNKEMPMKSQISELPELKKITVLDLINVPCAILDKDYHIITTNQDFLLFFNKSLVKVIGRSINDFANNFDQKSISIYDISDHYKLGVLYITYDDIELTQKLIRAKQSYLKIRSYFIPKRFSDIKTGIKNIGFTVCCSVMITPSYIDEENMNEWYTEAIFFEQWFEEKCTRYDDVDILRNTSREILIIYGINEKHSPMELFSHAMYTMIDILRYSIERDMSGNGIIFTAVLTSCENSDFIFSHDRNTTMAMFGEAFQKQMKLREYIAPNSVIVCKRSENMFRSLNIGVKLEKICDEAYGFTISQAEIEI